MKLSITFETDINEDEFFSLDEKGKDGVATYLHKNFGLYRGPESGICSAASKILKEMDCDRLIVQVGEERKVNTTKPAEYIDTKYGEINVWALEAYRQLAYLSQGTWRKNNLRGRNKSKSCHMV